MLKSLLIALLILLAINTPSASQITTDCSNDIKCPFCTPPLELRFKPPAEPDLRVLWNELDKALTYWNAEDKTWKSGLVATMGAETNKKSFQNRELSIDTTNSKEAGIDPQVVLEAIKKFPEIWQKKIRQIRFVNEERFLPCHYGISGKKMGALVQSHAEHGVTDIIFYRLDGRSPRETVNLTIHEIAHPNEWKAHHRSREERIKMAYEIYKRLQDKDRFDPGYPDGSKPGYVEQIKNIHNKMEEYWAEIVRFYFTEREKLPQKDIEIVEKYLH